MQRGLPSYTATHPDAKQRLQLAKALVALARADADAAGKLPADTNAAKRQALSTQSQQDAAAGAAPVTGAGSNADRSATAAALTHQYKQDQTGGRTGAGSQRKLHQQPTVGELLQQATGGAAGSTDSTTLLDTTPDRELLLEQLTALLRSQPYKPLQTDVGALDSALMHFVHKGPQGRLYLQDEPW